LLGRIPKTLKAKAVKGKKDMSEPIKRTKSIKIRLTDQEQEKLQELKQGNELATWIRTT
jgi:hypothetical protein